MRHEYDSHIRSIIKNHAPALALVASTTLPTAAAAQTELPASADQEEIAAFGPKGADPEEEFGAGARKREQPETPPTPPTDPATAEPPAAPAPAAEAPDRRVHIKIGVDWTTSYYFRGIRQEDRGFILQPYAELGFDLVTADSVSLTALFGVWNSFHDRQTGSDPASNDFTDGWYEADLYAGAALTLGRFGFSTIYTAYTSPADAFSTVDEVLFALSYDDSGQWGESSFRISPSLTLGLEVGADYTDGADTERGIYLQPGIAPGFTANLPLLNEVDFTFPIVVGLSLDNYYEDPTGEDNAFGYLSIGGKAAFALPIPKAYGDWTLTAGVYALFLGDTTEQLNDNDDTEVIGSVGISVEF